LPLAAACPPRAILGCVIVVIAPLAADWPIEAAELRADRSLYPALHGVWESLSPEDKAHFERSFVAALDACQPKDEQPENP